MQPLIFADISIFRQQLSVFVITGNTDKSSNTLFLILLAFIKSLMLILINLIAILIMSAKLSTPGLLNINVFWNKGYAVKIFVYDFTNKFLSHDSNSIIDVSMKPKKFGNSSNSITSVLWGFRMVLGMNLKFYGSGAKTLKLKARKI